MSEESPDKDGSRTHGDSRIYTSAGTISVQVSVKGDETGAMIFFVPDCHHVVQHGSKSYAVFVSCSGNACAVLRDLEKECCKKDCRKKDYCKKDCCKRGCCIKVKCKLSELGLALMPAAVSQCRVGINVEAEAGDAGELTLTSITVPAKRNK